MNKSLSVSSFALLASIAFSSIAFAGQYLELSSFKGGTFFETMTAQNGIKNRFDEDLEATFIVADKNTIRDRFSQFAPKVINKIGRFFESGMTPNGEFDRLLDSIAGKKATPKSFAKMIGRELESQNLVQDPSKIGLATVTLMPFLILVSDGGTTVMIDKNNRYLNVGYKKGGVESETIDKDVKSGRSFGASWKHEALDASDVDYLRELSAYLASESDPSKFYSTIVDTLTMTSSSGIKNLSEEGQTVFTDFLAIYTAELDRFAMTGFKKHPWQNDLAEATFLASFSVASGKILLDGEFRDGNLEEFFAQGQNGGGIGMTRRDRNALQAKIAEVEKQIHPEIVKELETVTGPSLNGDLIHALMLKLNSPDQQVQVKSHAADIRKAAVKFLTQICLDAPEISRQIALH